MDAGIFIDGIWAGWFVLSWQFILILWVNLYIIIINSEMIKNILIFLFFQLICNRNLQITTELTKNEEMEHKKQKQQIISEQIIFKNKESNQNPSTTGSKIQVSPIQNKQRNQIMTANLSNMDFQIQNKSNHELANLTILNVAQTSRSQNGQNKSHLDSGKNATQDSTQKIIIKQIKQSIKNEAEQIVEKSTKLNKKSQNSTQIIRQIASLPLLIDNHSKPNNTIIQKTQKMVPNQTEQFHKQKQSQHNAQPIKNAQAVIQKQESPSIRHSDSQKQSKQKQILLIQQKINQTKPEIHSTDLINQINIQVNKHIDNKQSSNNRVNQAISEIVKSQSQIIKQNNQQHTALNIQQTATKLISNAEQKIKEEIKKQQNTVPNMPQKSDNNKTTNNTKQIPTTNTSQIPTIPIILTKPHNTQQLNALSASSPSSNPSQISKPIQINTNQHINKQSNTNNSMNIHNTVNEVAINGSVITNNTQHNISPANTTITIKIAINNNNNTTISSSVNNTTATNNQQINTTNNTASNNTKTSNTDTINNISNPNIVTPTNTTKQSVSNTTNSTASTTITPTITNNTSATTPKPSTPVTPIILPLNPSSSPAIVLSDQPQLDQPLLRTRFGDRGLFLNTRNTTLKNSPAFRVIRNLSLSTAINPALLKLKQIRRNYDGSGNNQHNRMFGAVNTSLSRKCRANFVDGLGVPVNDLPSPRDISNVVANMRDKMQLNKDNVTLAFTLWGQFVDHDIQHSPSSENQSFHISIPRCDKVFDADCNGQRVIPFTRSVAAPGSSPRVPINSITTWLDASMVYGSSQSQAKKLRTFRNGQLKTDKITSQMLPQGQKVKPSTNSLFRNATDDKIPNDTMLAGDSRSNENLVLLSFHTIFLREHNRICDLIARNRFNLNLSTQLTDQQIYQISKNYVTGLIQKITYDDYLPIVLGKKAYSQLIGPYIAYNRSLDPSIQVQFSTAGFRFGHSLVVPDFPLVNLYGDRLEIIRLDNALFRPDLMTSINLERILRGASRTITKLRDGEFVGEIRNLLIIAPQLRNIRMDLMAINVQRGRDHGMPDYNSLRECYGLRRLNDFSQISGESSKNQQISQVYKNINKIDSYIGIQSEKGVDGSILGETGIAIVGRNFQKIRDADRFWYQRVFPSQIVAEIKATKLSQIIIRNTAIMQLQQDIFHYNFGQN